MRRTALSAALFTTLTALSTLPALAHGPSGPPHQLHRMGDLKLESGQVIKDFAIS